MFFLIENRQKTIILLNLVHFAVHQRIPEVEPLLLSFFRLDRTKSAYFSAIFPSPIYPLNLLLSNSLHGAWRDHLQQLDQRMRKDRDRDRDREIER